MNFTVDYLDKILYVLTHENGKTFGISGNASNQDKELLCKMLNDHVLLTSFKLRRGIVTINDDKKVRVEFKDKDYVECWKGEHDFDHFPIGEECSCLPIAIYKDATTGHTYLPVDWRDPFPDWPRWENDTLHKS